METRSPFAIWPGEDDTLRGCCPSQSEIYPGIYETSGPDVHLMNELGDGAKGGKNGSGLKAPSATCDPERGLH